MRPDNAVGAMLDQFEQRASPWTDEELREGHWIVNLALRMADGKPVRVPSQWLTADEYLSTRIGGRLRVALVARAQCRPLLELNPRDPVAREAHGKLSMIAAQLLDADSA